MVYSDFPIFIAWDKSLFFLSIETCSRDFQLSVTAKKKQLLDHLVLEIRGCPNIPKCPDFTYFTLSYTDVQQGASKDSIVLDLGQGHMSRSNVRDEEVFAFARCLSLHLLEIVEGLYFHCSLSVWLCVCLCVCLSVCLCVRHFL